MGCICCLMGRTIGAPICCMAMKGRGAGSGCVMGCPTSWSPWALRKETQPFW